MKDWEQIKKGISKELKSTLNTIDPAFEIENCLNLYSKVLNYKISIQTKDDLDGLEKTIQLVLDEYLIKGVVNDTSIGVFCKNFEQFIKKTYYILEENDRIESVNLLDRSKPLPLLPFLSVLNKIKPIYIDNDGKDIEEIELVVLDVIPKFKLNPQTGIKQYKRLYPSSLSFDDFTELNDVKLNEKYQNSFILYLIKAIILKNEQSHQAPDRSLVENSTNLNITLIAELYIINFFKRELNNSFKKVNYQNQNFDNYILSEKDRLQKQSERFVSLNLKEMTTQNLTGKSGFIEDILTSSFNRIRILGQGGSGKTTTLEYLLYKDCLKWLDSPSNSKIPILISLANLSSTEKILESIAKKLNTNIDYIEELLETNELKIYLDGINEMVQNRESKKIKLQEIDSLVENYPNLSLIITDRYEFDEYQNNMFNIPTFLIQKLDKIQINEFVKKYCNSEEQSNHVLKILSSKVNIQELLLRPLVLTRAIEIIKVDNDLPEKEGQIIEKFIDGLLRREKDEKKDPLLNVRDFKLVLAYAANEIWVIHTSNAPINEYAFNKILLKAANYFGLEKFNAGYISRIGYELEIFLKSDDSIQFYHQSYIEFFCKHYLKYDFQ